MEVDPSVYKTMQPSHALACQKSKPAACGRSAPHKGQGVNHVDQAPNTFDMAYNTAPSSAAGKGDDDAILEYDSETIKFVGENLCYPSSDEEKRGSK